MKYTTPITDVQTMALLHQLCGNSPKTGIDPTKPVLDNDLEVP